MKEKDLEDAKEVKQDGTVAQAEVKAVKANDNEVKEDEQKSEEEVKEEGKEKEAAGAPVAVKEEVKEKEAAGAPVASAANTTLLSVMHACMDREEDPFALFNDAEQAVCDPLGAFAEPGTKAATEHEEVCKKRKRVRVRRDQRDQRHSAKFRKRDQQDSPNAQRSHKPTTKLEQEATFIDGWGELPDSPPGDKPSLSQDLISVNLLKKTIEQRRALNSLRMKGESKRQAIAPGEFLT